MFTNRSVSGKKERKENLGYSNCFSIKCVLDLLGGTHQHYQPFSCSFKLFCLSKPVEKKCISSEGGIFFLFLFSSFKQVFCTNALSARQLQSVLVWKNICPPRVEIFHCWLLKHQKAPNCHQKKLMNATGALSCLQSSHQNWLLLFPTEDASDSNEDVCQSWVLPPTVSHPFSVAACGKQTQQGERLGLQEQFQRWERS